MKHRSSQISPRPQTTTEGFRKSVGHAVATGEPLQSWRLAVQMDGPTGEVVDVPMAIEAYNMRDNPGGTVFIVTANRGVSLVVGFLSQMLEPTSERELLLYEKLISAIGGSVAIYFAGVGGFDPDRIKSYSSKEGDKPS